MSGPLYTCPCCGFRTFESQPGSGSTCDVCLWRDDPSQLADPWRANGLNRLSLVDAQAKFSERVLQSMEFASAPLFHYERDPQWRVARTGDRVPSRSLSTTVSEILENGGALTYYWRRSIA